MAELVQVGDIGAQERQLTQLGEGWYVESGVGEQQAKI